MKIEFTSEEWIQEIPNFLSGLNTLQVVALSIVAMYAVAIVTSKLIYKFFWYCYKNSKKTSPGQLPRDYTKEEIITECRFSTIAWIVVPPLTIIFILVFFVVEFLLIPSFTSILTWWEKGLTNES